MMEDEQISSDESDVDYIPSSKELEHIEQVSECETEDGSDNDSSTEADKGKTKPRRKKRNKKESSGKSEKCNNTKNEIDVQKEVDSFWNDLKNSTVQMNGKVEDTNKEKVTETYEFAGEKVVVETDVNNASNKHGRKRNSGGLASIVGSFGKKNKLSILQKSKLDWDSFKKDEGISEMLEEHNKGKNGYLERQDFLKRADLRQFDVEKKLRNSRRTK